MTKLLKLAKKSCTEQGMTLSQLANAMNIKYAKFHHYLTGRLYIDNEFIKALAKELQEDEETIKSLVTISKVLYQAKD